MNAKYWNQKNYEAVENATTLGECLAVASEILAAIPRPVVLVSGPISTGGAGSPEKNMDVLQKAITELEHRGEHVFNQLPFEKKFAEIAAKYEGYCMPI